MPEEAFASPYYPLKGPPANAAERELLLKAQEKDKEDLQVGFLSESNRFHRLSAQEAAADNCTDLEYAYRICLHKGSVWDRIKGCSELDRVWKACTTRQAEILDELGFADKRRSEDELRWIVDEADRLYLRERKASPEGEGSF